MTQMTALTIHTHTETNATEREGLGAAAALRCFSSHIRNLCRVQPTMPPQNAHRTLAKPQSPRHPSLVLKSNEPVASEQESACASAAVAAETRLAHLYALCSAHYGASSPFMSLVYALIRKTKTKVRTTRQQLHVFDNCKGTLENRN